MAQNLLDVYAQERAGEKTDWFEILPLELLSTATRTSQLQNNTVDLGILLEVITANEAGAASFTPKILVPDAAGGADVVLVTFTAITANGTNMLVVYPTVLTDMGTERKAAALPRNWKLELTYAGTPATDKLDTRVFGRYI